MKTSRRLAAWLLTLGGITFAPLPADGEPGSRFSMDELEDAVVEAPSPRPIVPRAFASKPLRGPVDETRYIVGPGDRFVVTIFAPEVETRQTIVSPEGDLLLPGVGTVRVAGSTLQAAKQDVLDLLSQHLRNVKVHVALVELRGIEVHVIGNVTHPGTYVATALDLTGSLIAAAGGLGPGASRRGIRITRRTGDAKRADLVRYERLGDTEANPPVLDGDVIFVPFVKSEVLVDGAVELPGFYEHVDGDTIGSLLEIAGGLTRDARRDSVELRRFEGEETTVERILGLDDDVRGTELEDGDQLYVRFSEVRETQFVVIDGQVRFPGPYGINEGEDRLSDVIRRAGGFTDDASLGEAQLLRTRGAEKIDLEFERLKAIPVQDMSKIEYAYFKSKSRERKGLVVVDFERLAEGDTAEDRLLQDGDRVVVPERRETVTVSGNVTFPGLITYLPDRKASYYISQAGGYGANADRGGTRVIRALTGEWEPKGDAGIIVPGDEIWIPEKPERDWWQLAQDAVRFAASVATVYLVIDQATN